MNTMKPGRAAASLLEGLQDWLAEPPSAQPLTVIGSYRLF
jgi:hypothetical protein